MLAPHGYGLVTVRLPCPPPTPLVGMYHRQDEGVQARAGSWETESPLVCPRRRKGRMLQLPSASWCASRNGRLSMKVYVPGQLLPSEWRLWSERSGAEDMAGTEWGFSLFVQG